LNSLPKFPFGDQVSRDQLGCTVRSSGLSSGGGGHQTGQEMIGVVVGVGRFGLQQQPHGLVPQAEAEHQVDNAPALGVLAATFAFLLGDLKISFMKI
jgi:hypothetical protein